MTELLLGQAPRRRFGWSLWLLWAGCAPPAPPQGGGVGARAVAQLLEDASEADFLQGEGEGVVVDGDSLVLADGVAAGTFRSRVFDAGHEVTLDALEWLPDEPYDKPLPDGGAAEHGYPGGGLDMVDSALLLHFDTLSAELAAGIVSDTSGEASDMVVEGVEAVAPGVFGDALDDDVDGYLQTTVTEDHALQFGVSDLTWAYWLKTTQACPSEAPPSGNRVHLGIEEGGGVGTTLWLGCRGSWNAQCDYDDGTGRAGGRLDGAAFCGATPINDGRWHHVALVKEGHADATVSVYVDGQLDAQVQDSFVDPLYFEEEREWALGAFSTGTYQSAATFDEVVVLRRAWSADEVMGAFVRNQTRLTVAVRACAQPDCLDEPPFGTPHSDPAGGLSAPVVAQPSGVTGRYLQYEVSLGSDAPPHSPRLHHVALSVSGQSPQIDTATAPTHTTPPPGDTAAPIAGGAELPGVWFCAQGAPSGAWGLLPLALIGLRRRR